MVLKDKVYRFEIFYWDGTTVDGKKKFVYSDSNDIYGLEGVPKTTHHIYCYYKNLKDDKDWENEAEYLIGDEMSQEDAAAEIKKLNDLKAYCKDETSDTIYLNNNIDLDTNSIRNRIIVSSWFWWTREFIPISPKQIKNGKIYPIKQINGENEEKKNNEGDLYLDLE